MTSHSRSNQAAAVVQLAAGPQLAHKHFAAAPQTRSSTQVACSRLWTGTPTTQEKLSSFYSNQDISLEPLSEEEQLRPVCGWHTRGQSRGPLSHLLALFARSRAIITRRLFMSSCVCCLLAAGRPQQVVAENIRKCLPVTLQQSMSRL